MTTPDLPPYRRPPAPPEPIGAATPVIWTAQTEDEQEHQLSLLTEWVNWLIHRYRLDQRTIPPCWPQHGELIEELAALHLAWQAAYAKLATGEGPLRWHEHFDLARGRLSGSVSRAGCRASTHRPPTSA